MKRFAVLAGALLIVFVAVGVSLSAVQPIVVGVDVTGNQEVVSQHILGVIGTKSGEPINRDQIQMDIETIYGLGFFSLVDVEVTQQSGGVFVEFQVQENPEVREIVFTGNTVYTSDELMELVFTQPGSIFNNVFFRHDLQRIKEKYEKDGYVLVRIEDVGFSNGVVTVKIIEPKVGEVIIQGNTKTKTYVIERQFKLKSGDLFNATVLRHSLNKLNQLGYLEDVNVGFEPTDKPEVVNIVVTVQEGKSARLGLSIGHGTSSGWSGGASYEETNYKGLGHRATIGFEIGDKEQYWVSYEDPYMDQAHSRWKAGIFKHTWEDLEDSSLTTEYKEDKKGIYYGTGRKFINDSTLSWFVNLDLYDVSYTFDTAPSPVPEKFYSGRNMSITGTVTRNTMNEYLSFPEGEVQSLNVEYGIFRPDDSSIGEMNYTKYWLETRYYWPLYRFFQNLIDREIGTEDNPVVFATRIRVGFSSGEMPWSAQYFIGGSTTLRGYKDDYFSGSKMVLGNFELRIPIQDSFSVVGFYDIGMASDVSAFSNTKSGYGLGVRVKTGIGDIRLDFANGEEENRAHFSFGEMF